MIARRRPAGAVASGGAKPPRPRRLLFFTSSTIAAGWSANAEARRLYAPCRCATSMRLLPSMPNRRETIFVFRSAGMSLLLLLGVGGSGTGRRRRLADMTVRVRVSVRGRQLAALGQRLLDRRQALAQLGGHRWENPPRGFIDVGRLLSDPSDIVIPLKHASKAVQEASEEALRSLFGRTYVPTMRPTPMLRRLARMKAEVDRGHESLRRKLRYLFWLN